jgi:hypothetical protein
MPVSVANISVLIISSTKYPSTKSHSITVCNKASGAAETEAILISD